MAETAVSAQEDKIINPLTGEELDPEKIAAEALARTNALRFATQEEIERCLEGTGPNTMLHHYLMAFHTNPRVPTETIKEITQARTNVDHNILRAGINKGTAIVPRNGLNINAEKPIGSDRVVAWLLQSTRVLVLNINETPKSTIALHETAKSIKDSLEPHDSAVLECLIDQHLGIPLNHLALYAETENEAVLEAINRINNALKPLNICIHVRNGIAILGTNQGSITAVNNAETRRNLFPKKEQKETPESKIAKLEELLLEAHTTIANLEARATSAESQALEALISNDELDSTNKALQSRIEQLEKSSMETNDGKEILALKQQITDLESKLAVKDTDLKASREEARAAKKELEGEKRETTKLNQRIVALTQRADEAEEARAAAMRKAGRGGVDVDSARDKATIQDLEETIRRGEEQLRSLRNQLQRQNGLTTIHPEELARLKRASTELAGASETIRNLQRQLAERKSPAQPEQKDSPELAQLRAELAAKDAALAKAQQDLAQSAQQVTALTNELRETTELLESATSSTPAPVKTPIPTPKAAVATAPAQAPKPKPAPIEDPIKQIEKNNFSNSEELINTVIKALTLNAGTAQHGLPKSKLRELRNALTNLQLGRDSWLHDTRVKIAKALNEMKEKGNGDHIPVEAVEACIRTIDGLPK